jgi:nickel-dependent lactate racemase
LKKKLASWYVLIGSGYQSIAQAQKHVDEAEKAGLENTDIIYILGIKRGFAVHSGKFYSLEECKKQEKKCKCYYHDAFYLPLTDEPSLLRIFFTLAVRH